ncbi:MAG: DUF2723 domain-containing protein [Flavobacteriaceae bacterium]|nr:DUF2723 domain-containing protein [Flavobacteriaceae bacterium]
MNHLNYKKLNIIFGWVVFAIALITYTITREPTVSYWDCGEYIPTSDKLQVGHPPGAPLFQMLGAYFAMFAKDPVSIAKMINFMSALASALTILFMFWTITILAKKVVGKNKELSPSKIIAIIGSGLVGSLAYAFSDSFWFSAVEAEVYASSSFLMALLFWMGLRWEEEMDEPRGHKWLLLISFVVGLSFGVHILTLLVIPSLVFIYFFKRYKNITIKQFIIANIVAVLMLAFVFKFLFPYTLAFFSASELFFVNSVGLPFNSGSIIAAIVLVAIFYFAIRYTRRKKKIHANLVLLTLLFTMIGFSSWLMLPIRANANTTINENDPSSARELLAYYNREQYGDSNIFYDSYYSETREQDPNDPYRDDKPKYEKDEKAGKYIIVNRYKDALPNYTDKNKGFIPRMVDPTPSVVANYKAIAGIPQNSKRRPTFGENLKFMIDYQFGYMYGRYFMWNFVGRQDDIQGQLDNHGNWLSGINFIDDWHLSSPQENLPDDVKNNKGRNTYFFLPLILGLIGLFFHIKEDKKNFYVLLLFFVFTGFAVIFYTNPKPFEPRERDYAVVGSFYIFAIWIGLGVLALYEQFKEKVNKKALAIGLTVVALLAVPVLMVSQNWDDHTRNGRYTARNNAKAYLDSAQKNAIMFTIGDNDTFPLWYMQETEGYRPDLKLINTSLFATDWYIDQQKRKTYTADPIPSQLTHDQYKTGSLDVAYHIQDPRLKDTVIDIKSFMNWLASDDPRTFIDIDEDGNPEKYYPTNKIRIPVDKDTVLKYGIVPEKDSAKIVPYIDIEVDKLGLTKNRILMLDIIANNDWKRPIYFTGGAQADDEYIWMKDYLQLDGMAFKLVPIKTPARDSKGRAKSILDIGRIDTDTMYNNIKKWSWRSSNDPKVYIDVESRKNSISYRNNLVRLAEAFIAENKPDKAEEVLDLSLEKMPIETYDHYGLVLGYIENYYKIGKTEKARKVARTLDTIFKQQIDYYSTLNQEEASQNYDDIEATLLMYNNIVATADEYDKEFADTVKKEYVDALQLLKHLMGE